MMYKVTAEPRIVLEKMKQFRQTKTVKKLFAAAPPPPPPPGGSGNGGGDKNLNILNNIVIKPITNLIKKTDDFNKYKLNLSDFKFKKLNLPENIKPNTKKDLVQKEKLQNFFNNMLDGFKNNKFKK